MVLDGARPLRRFQRRHPERRRCGPIRPILALGVDSDLQSALQFPTCQEIEIATGRLWVDNFVRADFHRFWSLTFVKMRRDLLKVIFALL